jgi:hypothetical protein
MHSPGPWQYNILRDSVDKKGPNCKFGNEERKSIGDNSIPGPSVYSPRDENST